MSTRFTLRKILIRFICDLSCTGQAIVWCYRCVSTHPGCGDKFDWRWHWSYTCPGINDRCVKIIEKKGADAVITRDCLSSLQGIRRDIPADVYEGCRPAASDVKLAQYVFNDISELDIKRYVNWLVFCWVWFDWYLLISRNYYDNTTFCFCDFDHLCNSGGKAVPTATFIALVTLFTLAVQINWASVTMQPTLHAGFMSFYLFLSIWLPSNLTKTWLTWSVQFYKIKCFNFLYPYLYVFVHVVKSRQPLIEQ